MSHPFRVDDVVYHAAHGEGFVCEIECPKSVKNNGRSILVRFPDSPIKVSPMQLVAPIELSFKPWPQPCHERPFKPTLLPGEEVAVVQSSGGGIKKVVVNYEFKEGVVSAAGLTYWKDGCTFYRLTNPFKTN